MDDGRAQEDAGSSSIERHSALGAFEKNPTDGVPTAQALPSEAGQLPPEQQTRPSIQTFIVMLAICVRTLDPVRNLGKKLRRPDSCPSFSPHST